MYKEMQRNKKYPRYPYGSLRWEETGHPDKRNIMNWRGRTDGIGANKPMKQNISQKQTYIEQLDI